MRIAINTETRKVVTWANASVDSLSLTRGDRILVEVRFIEGPGYIQLPEGATGLLFLKTSGQYASQPVAAADSWALSGVGKAATYLFYLELLSVEIDALFNQEQASVGLALEIEWAYDLSGRSIRQTSIPVPTSLSNEYIRQDDGTPSKALDYKATQQEAEAGVDNAKWMTPLRTKQAIDFAAESERPTISSVPPVPLYEGQQWTDTTDLTTYEFIGGAWVET